jgi:hypothetical protein
MHQIVHDEACTVKQVMHVAQKSCRRHTGAMDDYGRRLAEQLVIEVKAAMARAGISSSRALGRVIGQSSQYVSTRLDGGNPRTGERVPLNVRDMADIAEALGLPAHVLVERAEDALEQQDRAEHGRVVEFGRERHPEDDYVLAALDRDDDVEVEAQQVEP